MKFKLSSVGGKIATRRHVACGSRESLFLDIEKLIAAGYSAAISREHRLPTEFYFGSDTLEGAPDPDSYILIWDSDK